MPTTQRAPLSAAQPQPVPTEPRSDGAPYATPYVRRMAQQRGLEPRSLAPSGSHLRPEDLNDRMEVGAHLSPAPFETGTEGTGWAGTELDVSAWNDDFLGVCAQVAMATTMAIREAIGPDPGSCRFVLLGTGHDVREAVVPAVTELDPTALRQRLVDAQPSPHSRVASPTITVTSGLPGKLRMPMRADSLVELSLAQPECRLRLAGEVITRRTISDLELAFRIDRLGPADVTRILANIAQRLGQPGGRS